MANKKALTQAPINEMIAARWSPRAFDISRPVSIEQLISIAEAGRWAPSCFGDEPWRYLIWNQHSNNEAWSRAFKYVGEWNKPWVKNAPVLILVSASTLFKFNGEPNNWYAYDTGAASENICLQATSLGLHAHQLGGFDPAGIKEEFNIPEQFACLAMIAIGFRATSDILNRDHAELENAERKRQPLGSNFFKDEWEKGIDHCQK